MNLPIPTNNNNKLKLGPMPVLPSVFERLIPIPVPPLEYKPGIAGLVEGLFHNWSLKHLQRAAEREAGIAEARLQQTRAQFQQIEEMLMFGHRYYLAMQKVKQEQEMLGIDKQVAEANLATIQLKNFLAQIEAQKAQLELQQMQKELGNGSDKENGE